LVAALEHRMGGNQLALLIDPDLVGQGVHLDHAPAGGIGHAVEVAAHADHALAGDPPLQAQHRVERSQRQRPQEGLFLSKGFGDDAACGGMHAGVGHCGKPVLQLPVQILEIAEGAGQEEVFPDVAEGPLDLAFGLGPVRPAGFGMEAEVAGQIDERSVVDDAAGMGLAGDHGLHAVIEDLVRHAAQRLEGGHVAAQQSGQVLMQDEAGPDQAAVAEHQREQPHDARCRGLVGEHHLELGEVDLGLLAGGGLEADLKGGWRCGTDLAQEVSDSGVAAGITALPDLAEQAAAGQARKGTHALAQVAGEGIEDGLTRLAWAISRRLQAAGDVLADRLAVEAALAGNG
jgi:hypothetical protein